MGKTVKMSFEGKSQQEPRNWQMDRILIILKKENGPRASSAPALGLNTIIFKHVYWYMQQTQVSVYRTIGPLVCLCDNKGTDQLCNNSLIQQLKCLLAAPVAEGSRVLISRLIIRQSHGALWVRAKF